MNKISNLFENSILRNNIFHLKHMSHQVSLDDGWKINDQNENDFNVRVLDKSRTKLKIIVSLWTKIKVVKPKRNLKLKFSTKTIW